MSDLVEGPTREATRKLTKCRRAACFEELTGGGHGQRDFVRMLLGNKWFKFISKSMRVVLSARKGSSSKKFRSMARGFAESSHELRESRA